MPQYESFIIVRDFDMKGNTFSNFNSSNELKNLLKSQSAMKIKYNFLH